MFCGLDELVGDVVVDPDIAHTKGQHSQRVLVVVGQRAMADCAGEERSQMAVFHPTVPAFFKNALETNFGNDLEVLSGSGGPTLFWQLPDTELTGDVLFLLL